MKHQGIFIIVLSILLISGCGSDSITSGQANMEKALFVSYAGSKTGEDLNAVMIGDLEDVVTDLIATVQTYLMEYYSENRTLPSRIDLDDPPSGIDVPVGMGGYITSTIATFSASAHLTLNNYTLGSRTYSGTLDADGVLDIVNIDFLTLNVDTSSLEITYTGKSFTTCAYSNWTFYRDSSDDYPDYALTGSFAVDENTYSFTGFAYTRPGSSSLSIAGTVGFDGISYIISGSVGCDTSGTWTSGDMTIVTPDESVGISLSTTAAIFNGTMGDWTKEDWRQDRLAP
ncbi:MAG: hypothetical protein U9P49_13980 [Thermodesulfobacteriota bacterium]|nr:hypothetical protein [Thermodesulfobacteriota bacterium]